MTAESSQAQMGRKQSRLVKTEKGAQKMARKLSKDEIRDKIDGNELDLSMCQLVKVPVRELVALPKATILDLSRNRLTNLPDSFCSLKHLVELDLSNNSLTELPEDFGSLRNLRKIDLSSNELTNMPTSCCKLDELQWLDLKGNPIQTLLPDIVGDCLDAKDCKHCAKNMLQYLKMKQSDEERERQLQLQRERELRESQALEEKKEKELRRRLKQQERQQKREAYEAMERQKRLMAEEMNRDLKAQEEFMETRPSQEPAQIAEDDGGILGILLILIVVTIIIAIGLVVFCHHDTACRELLAAFSS